MCFLICLERSQGCEDLRPSAICESIVCSTSCRHPQASKLTFSLFRIKIVIGCFRITLRRKFQTVNSSSLRNSYLVLNLTNQACKLSNCKMSNLKKKKKKKKRKNTRKRNYAEIENGFF